MKAFVDDRLNVAKMTISLFDGVEKMLGKGRKCRLPAFSPFPTMFSKGLSPSQGHLKSRLCGKGLWFNPLPDDKF